MAVVFIEQRSETVDGRRQAGRTQDQGRDGHQRRHHQAASSATASRPPASPSTEARETALLLRGGALAAPISIANERVIGPQLGQANIEKGVRALVIGMLALFAFMIIYYQLFGVVANLVLHRQRRAAGRAAVRCSRSALSLPGIAGIILTVGMAVDANVLIYERIREELRNGVSPQAAIKAGFEKAFSAIADSNVTTFIAGVVLFVFGTGADQGFRDRAVARHPHFDVHRAHGQPRIAHADVWRQAQDRQAGDRLSPTG